MVALIDEAAQDGFHRGEGFDLTFNVGNLYFGARADIPAFLLRLNAQRQKLPNLTEREAPCLARLMNRSRCAASGEN